MQCKNIKYLITSIIVVVFITLLLGATIPVAGESSTSEAKGLQTIIGEIYAKHYGVTLDEAIHRLKIQDSFPGLSTELEREEPATFGGLWIQHEPNYKIIAAFTSNGADTFSRYTKYIPTDIASYFEVRTVDKSLNDLMVDQANLLSSFKVQGLKTNSRVDVINNCVSIDIIKSDEKMYTDTKQNGKLMMPDKLKVNFVDGLAVPATNIYGGLTLQYYQYYGGDTGTIGFGVQNFYGTRGIVTVGHCTNTPYFNQILLPMQGSEWCSYSYDCQWHTCPGFTVTNEIKYWSDGSTLDITGQESRDEQNIGDIVSKYGFVTYYTCGELTSKTFNAAPTIPNSTSTWMEVSNIYGYQKMGEKGDSGGPCFTGDGGSGATALGILSMVSDDRQKMYYMAMNYMSILPIYLLTSP